MIDRLNQRGQFVERTLEKLLLLHGLTLGMMMTRTACTGSVAYSRRKSLALFVTSIIRQASRKDGRGENVRAASQGENSVRA